MLLTFSKTWTSLALASMVIVACGNHTMMRVGFLEQGGGQAENLFTKSMEVLDESGENKVYLTIKSNDAELLEVYTPNVFTLTVLFERSPLSTIEDDHGEDERLGHSQEPEHENTPFVEYEVNSSVLVPQAMGFRLSEHLPPGHQRFFMWRYSYSYDKSFKIRRASLGSRVFVKAWYQNQADEDWLPWLDERNIKASEIFRASMPSAHQLKVGIKARRVGHYELEFFERE